MQIGVGTKDQRGEASLAAEEQIRGCHPPALSRVSYLGQCSQYNNLDHQSRGSGSQISNNLVDLKNLESSNKQPIKFWHDDHNDNDHPIPASPPWTLSSGLLADQFSNMSTKTGNMEHLKTVKSLWVCDFKHWSSQEWWWQQKSFPLRYIFWNAGGLGWSIGKLEYLTSGSHWHRCGLIVILKIFCI